MAAQAGQPESGKLTFKQERFVAAYLGEAKGNATEAARIAGYKRPHPEGSRLLRNATIAARVKQTVEQAGITAEAIIAELADVGFAEWREFVEVIARDRKGTPIKVKMDLSNKVKALELLGKHHQLFTDKQVIDLDLTRYEVVGVPDDALAAMFRPAGEVG